jgi:membrane protease YdiL (CAAX protease family)
MSYPTLLTLTYFIWLSNSLPALQQLIYAIGKLIQFGFPMVYVAMTAGFPALGQPFQSMARDERNQAGQPVASALRKELSTQSGPLVWSSVLIGALSGIAVVLVLMLVYHLFLPDTLAVQFTEKVQLKIQSMGLNSLGKFLALSIFYIFGHSLLEEYYWRWFVFDQLQQTLPPWRANLVASLGFMAHHVILLATFFGWDSPLTYLLSASVAVGGCFWAWLFNRPWGFRSAWLSHAIVDAGIFGLAISLIFG